MDYAEELKITGVVGVGGGWAQYRSAKWNTKIIESQRPSVGPYWTFLVLTALQIEDNRHWPALRGLSSPPSTNARKLRPSNGAKVTLEAYTGAATETRLVTLEQDTQWNMIVY